MPSPDREPRDIPRPADYEDGTRKLSKGQPLSDEVLEAPSRVRMGLAAHRIRVELAERTFGIHDSQIWGPDTVQGQILEHHAKADDLARHLVNPADSGNAD